MGFVQSAQNKATSTTVTATLGSAATVGNCIIALVSASSGSVSNVKIGGVADNFALAGPAASNTYGVSTIWTDQDLQQTSTSVVVTNSASASICFTVIEWNGIATSSAVDQYQYSTSGSGTAWTSGTTATLSASNDVAFGVGTTAGNTSTLTGPGAYTNQAQQSQGTVPVVNQLTGYQVLSSTAGVTYNGTQTASGQYNAGAVVALKTGGSLTVNLSLLTINTASGTLNPPIYVNLPLLTINTADFALTPGIGIVVNLPLLTINTAAFALTPDVVPSVVVNLPLLTINTSEHNLTPNITPVPPKLLVAIAARAGTDPYAGYSYPAGITQFNSQTQFINILSGIISFMASLSQANAGIIQTLNTPGFMDILSGKVDNTDVESEVFLESRQSGGGIATVAVNTDQFQVNAPSNLSGAVDVSSTLQTQGDVTVNSANLNVGNGSSANLNLSPKIATPPNLAAVIAQTASLAQTQACLGAFIQSWQNRGAVS